MDMKKIWWRSFCSRIYEFLRMVFYGPRRSVYTVAQIAERMKPVPYESIEHLLPHKFAERLGHILTEEERMAAV